MIQKILKTIERVEIFLAKILLATMIVVVALQVFCRYLLNKPLAWPEELSSFLLIWLTYLIADVLLKRQGHVQIDFFTGKLSGKTQHMISIVVNIYILVFLGFLIVNSIQIEMLQIHHVVGAALKVPKAFYTLAVTVSSISMALSIGYSIWLSLEQLKILPTRTH